MLAIHLAGEPLKHLGLAVAPDDSGDRNSSLRENSSSPLLDNTREANELFEPRADYDNSSSEMTRKIIPMLMSFVDLKDMPLIKGFSGAINMFDMSQAGRVGNKQENLSENLTENLTEQQKMFSELFSSKPFEKLFLAKEKEHGHTMALSGYVMLLGATVGSLFGLGKTNLANSFGGLVKNAGALVSNYSMYMHPNKNLVRASRFYFADALLDSVQRLIPKEETRRLSHLVMSLNNLASNFYTRSARDVNEANTLLYS